MRLKEKIIVLEFRRTKKVSCEFFAGPYNPERRTTRVRHQQNISRAVNGAQRRPSSQRPHELASPHACYVQAGACHSTSTTPKDSLIPSAATKHQQHVIQQQERGSAQRERRCDRFGGRQHSRTRCRRCGRYLARACGGGRRAPKSGAPCFSSSSAFVQQQPTRTMALDPTSRTRSARCTVASASNRPANNDNNDLLPDFKDQVRNATAAAARKWQTQAGSCSCGESGQSPPACSHRWWPSLQGPSQAATAPQRTHHSRNEKAFVMVRASRTSVPMPRMSLLIDDLQIRSRSGIPRSRSRPRNANWSAAASDSPSR